MDFIIQDIDQGIDRLAHGMDVERKPVARPVCIDVARPARDMIAQLVDIGRNTPPGLVAAELVRNVNVDRSFHGWKDEAVVVAFQRRWLFDGE